MLVEDIISYLWQSSMVDDDTALMLKLITESPEINFKIRCQTLQVRIGQVLERD
jgi:hypothetical protein